VTVDCCGIQPYVFGVRLFVQCKRLDPLGRSGQRGRRRGSRNPATSDTVLECRGVIVGTQSILLKNSGSELVEVLQGDRRFGIVQARGDSHLWRRPASGDLASATELFVALHRPNTRSTPKSSPPKIRVFQQNRQDLPLARTPESSPKRSCGERVPMSCPTDPGQVPANGPPRAQSPEIGIREC